MNTFVRWLPLALVTTFLSGLIYVAVQQDYRQTANDPQIQLSEDLAAKLDAGGAVPTSPAEKVDIAKSLAPFMVVFDDSGHVLAAEGALNGKDPEIPSGIFDFTRTHHQDRVTWQPATDVRVATIITRYSSNKGSGFVLAGRSLREVEKREVDLHWTMATIWILGLVCSFIISLLGERTQKKK